MANDRCLTCGASLTSPLTARNLPGYPLCPSCGAVTSIRSLTPECKENGRFWIIVGMVLLLVGVIITVWTAHSEHPYLAAVNGVSVGVVLVALLMRLVREHNTRRN